VKIVKKVVRAWGKLKGRGRSIAGEGTGCGVTLVERTTVLDRVKGT